MAGFAGYFSASFTTQKIQMVCFLYFYLGEWLSRRSEVNRRKYIGLMVSDTILFLFRGHVSNGNAHNKDEAQRNESLTYFSIYRSLNRGTDNPIVLPRGGRKLFCEGNKRESRDHLRPANDPNSLLDAE